MKALIRYRVIRRTTITHLDGSQQRGAFILADNIRLPGQVRQAIVDNTPRHEQRDSKEAFVEEYEITTSDGTRLDVTLRECKASDWIKYKGTTALKPARRGRRTELR